MNLVRLASATAAISLLATSFAAASVVRTTGHESNHARVAVAFGGEHASRPNLSCPSQYSGGCVTPTASSPAQFEWCVSTSGNCSSGLVGTFDWTSSITLAKNGKAYKGKKFSSTWSPDPGNPSVLTISAKRKKAKGTKVVYADSQTTCSSSYGCFSDFVVYGITN
jgi:hypothetical protein